MPARYGHKTHPIGISTRISTFAGHESRNLTATDLRVFLHLIGQLTSGSTVWVYFVDIAKALGCDRSSVSRAIRRLEQAEVITVERIRPGRNSEAAVTIDPYLAFRGTPDRMVQDKRAWSGRRGAQPPGGDRPAR